MTESEAKKLMLIEKECINRDCDRNCANCDIVQKVEDLNNAYDMAISALEEVEKYRNIGVVSADELEQDLLLYKADREILSMYNSLGAVEELRVAKEKQIPKKPNTAIDSSWGIKKEVHVCPVCDCYLTEVHFIGVHKIESNKKVTFCENCGQAIDWSDED